MYSRTTRLIREKAEMSQPEFAEALGCNQSTISRLEKGIRKPSIDIIKRMIKFASKYNMKLSILDFFADE